MAEPVLKWAGGKRQLLDDLYARFPASFSTTENSYHEPFFGGGALFFDLEPDSGTVNDANPRLVNFYQQVRDNPVGLIQRCREFKDPTHEDGLEGRFADEENYYYQQRARFNWLRTNEDADPLEDAALLLYLNRTGFNGMYRENSDGEFNIPIGDLKNPDWVRAKQVRTASRVLNQLSVESIHKGDFSYIVDEVERDDLIYFDPPYEPMSATANFNDYHASGFGIDDQSRLLDTVTELDQLGVHVILSNSAVMHDQYQDAGLHVDFVDARRYINSDGENRDKVQEVVATNVAPEDRGYNEELSLDSFL